MQTPAGHLGLVYISGLFWHFFLAHFCKVLFPLFNSSPRFFSELGFLTNPPFSSTTEAVPEILLYEASLNFNTLITVHVGFSTPHFLPN